MTNKPTGDVRVEQAREVAWLIEWPADKHSPIRYFAAGEQAVIDANDATRFSRRQDAEAVKRAEKLQGVRVVEHMWMGIAAEQRLAASQPKSVSSIPTDMATDNNRLSTQPRDEVVDALRVAKAICARENGSGDCKMCRNARYIYNPACFDRVCRQPASCGVAKYCIRRFILTGEKQS